MNKPIIKNFDPYEKLGWKPYTLSIVKDRKGGTRSNYFKCRKCEGFLKIKSKQKTCHILHINSNNEVSTK